MGSEEMKLTKETVWSRQNAAQLPSKHKHLVQQMSERKPSLWKINIMFQYLQHSVSGKLRGGPLLSQLLPLHKLLCDLSKGLQVQGVFVTHIKSPSVISLKVITVSRNSSRCDHSCWGTAIKGHFLHKHRKTITEIPILFLNTNKTEAVLHPHEIPSELQLLGMHN